jgi:Amt family ammonium transporter
MPEINAGDTAWVLMSAALVMLMTPGLALFYGGLVRRKNVLSTIMHSFFILGLVSVTWVLWGYTLAFGPDTGLGLIGGLEWLGLEGVTGEPSDVYATTVPHLARLREKLVTVGAPVPVAVRGVGYRLDA